MLPDRFHVNPYKLSFFALGTSRYNLDIHNYILNYSPDYKQIYNKDISLIQAGIN